MKEEKKSSEVDNSPIDMKAKMQNLLKKARESVQPSLTPNEDKDANLKAIQEAKDLLSKDEELGVIDDPNLKHTLFYKGIQPIFRRILPKGEKYKELRDYVNGEKKKFLNRGKEQINGVTGSDSRMSYNRDMKELLGELQESVLNNEGVIGIIDRLKKLNERYENK